MASLEDSLESARRLSNGTMPVRVVLSTDKDVKAAKTILKGKKWAKCVEPITREAVEQAHATARAAIAKKLGVRK